MLDKIRSYYRNLSKKNKVVMPLMLVVFVVLFFIGISMVYAFYHNSLSFSIIANKVGSFGSGNGDMAIVIYKQSNDLDSATPEYKQTYGVPRVGYILDTVDCTATCTDNPSDSCYYTYNSDTNMFTITSDKKVTCKFYFKKTADSDVNVYIAIEDANGSLTYNQKNYREVESIPAYGYEYAGYTCKNDATVTYNQELKTFSVATLVKNDCYAYFYKTMEADIIVNVYVQTDLGSNIYQEVKSIPTNKAYVVSTRDGYKSACYDSEGVETSSVITYSGGYVTVDATEKQTCNIYLDLYEGAPLIESMTATPNDNSIIVSATTKVGTNSLNCFKFRLNDLTELSECQTEPTYTFTGLNICTYYSVTMFAIDSAGVEVGYTRTFKTTGC